MEEARLLSGFKTRKVADEEKSVCRPRLLLVYSYAVASAPFYLRVCVWSGKARSPAQQA